LTARVSNPNLPGAVSNTAQVGARQCLIGMAAQWSNEALLLCCSERAAKTLTAPSCSSFAPARPVNMLWLLQRVVSCIAPHTSHAQRDSKGKARRVPLKHVETTISCSNNGIVRLRKPYAFLSSAGPDSKESEMLPPFRRPHCLQTGRCNAHCRGNPMPRCDAFYRTPADVMKLILLSMASDSLCRSSCCSAMRPRASQLSPASQRIQWGYPALKSVIAGIPNSLSPMYARCFSPWRTCVYPVRRGYLGDELRECIPWILFRRITDFSMM
jgi:hypothetical protein